MANPASIVAGGTYVELDEVEPDEDELLADLATAITMKAPRTSRIPIPIPEPARSRVVVFTGVGAETGADGLLSVE